MTSWAIMARPKWSIVCPDGKTIRFESNDEVDEAIKAMKKDH